MGTSYRNDQFFNIDKAGETGLNGFANPQTGNWNIRGANNPEFHYPDRTIRTYKDGQYQTEILRRGYIRSMRTKVEEINVPIIKCQFQFNPEYLTQSVQMASSLYDVFHQTPEQFAQPFVGGGVNFTFSLLFDRSMELNRVDFGGFDPLTGQVKPQYNEANPWEQSDPSQVGVLRDLATLFSVIGQGVSQSQVDYQTALLKRGITLDATNQGDLDPADVQAAIDNSAAFLKDEQGNNVNLGNTSFLLPTPVRVVFSSLYIVEGLVNQSDVELVKFNTNMVPMVAKVTLSMDAKYIGFAKEKTYLQTILDKEIADYQREQQEAKDAAKALAHMMNAGAGRVEMMLSGNNTISPGDTYPVDSSGFLDFFTLAEGEQYRMYWRIPYATSANAVRSAFQDGSSIAINVYPKMRVYGPFGGTTLGAPGLSQSVLRQFCTGTPILSGTGVWPTAAITLDNWDDYTDGESTAQTPSYTHTALSPSDVANGYYVVHYEVQGTAIVDGETVNGSGEAYRAFGPGLAYETVKNFNQVVTLAWNAPSSIGDVTIQDGTATLVDDNVSTQPPAAGSVNTQVGTPNGNLS